MSKKQPHCSKCGRRLTDSYSIAVGMGPECRGDAARLGKLPKPTWKVQGGRVLFTGLAPAEPLPTHVEKQTMPALTWMRDANDALAASHWIKIWGQWAYTGACGQIIPRFGAKEVETERLALAGAPGHFYDKPTGQACETCLRKAQQQA